MLDRDTIHVEAAVLAAPKLGEGGPAAILSPVQARLPPQRRRMGGFTLAELLVTVGVLALLVFLFTQLLNSAATVTNLGHKQMGADSQARQLLDRMAIDFAQMVKRSDVDYYLKSSATAPLRRVLQPGNDRIAFYSNVPGYYPTGGLQGSVSLVAYRVNSDSTSSAYNKMERMGKGLLWNGSTPTSGATPPPVVFIPIPLASPLPSPLPNPMPNPSPTPAWPEASNATTSWSDSEVIGPQVIRFEYYYLLKNGTTSDIPWYTTNAVNGMQDVAAVIVDIAVIDPRSRALLGATETQINAQIATLAGTLIDYGGSAAAGCPSPNWQAPGELRRQWQCVLDSTNGLPRPALSGIRLYERFFYLSQ
jgi:type II secretory pathway component PulJ